MTARRTLLLRKFGWTCVALLLLLAPVARLGAEEARPAPVTEVRSLDKEVPEGLDDLRAIQKQVRRVVAKVMPATVGLRIGPAHGSGVLVSEDGYVLTAGHVAGRPGREVTVILSDGRRVKGVTLGSNRGIDSGMVKITTEGKWPHVPMGHSADLKRGQWCLTLGHPGGFQPGRPPVLRLGRILYQGPLLLRSTCTLVGGDSGGPLFDLEGRVIGIHSRIGENISANIHVPVDTYRDTWDRLVKSDTWDSRADPDAPPYLGVQMDPDADECRITEVIPGAAADQAGLRPHDVVLKFNGRRIYNADDLIDAVRRMRPGDKVPMVVRRGEETLTLNVLVGQRDE